MIKIQEKEKSNFQQEVLQESIKNLLKLIIEPFISQTITTTTTTTTTTTLDDSKLQEHSLAFSIQLYQSINQIIQSNQLKQTDEILEKLEKSLNPIQQGSIHPAQSESNLPSDSIKPVPNELINSSSLSEHNVPSSSSSSSSSSSCPPPIKSIPSPQIDPSHVSNKGFSVKPNRNLLDDDSISEDLRLYIQSEIEDGFNDLAIQFDESLQDAKHQLVSINRSLFESTLGKKKDSTSDQTLSKLPQPLSKIQVGSLGEKLKFQFEAHLIQCYRDYLKRFSDAIGYTGCGETSLDMNDIQQVQILNPGPHSNDQLPDQPNQSLTPKVKQNVDQQIEQTVTKKLESYQVELQKQANQFRNQIHDNLQGYIKRGSNEMNETIDQIEKILVREKNELMKLKKQIDSIGQRMNQLETEFRNETNPIQQRSNVLKSLGLIQSNDDSHQLQKLNLNIFLTKLNNHLKINLSQILINHPDSHQIITIPESTDQLNHNQPSGPPQVNHQDSNQPDLIPKPKSYPFLQQAEQDSNRDEEFIDKFIVKLIARMNQTLSFFDDECNQTIQIDQQNTIPEDSNPIQDSIIKDQNQQDLDQEAFDIQQENEQKVVPKEAEIHHPTQKMSPLNHEHPLSIVNHIEQIHTVLSHFFDLNFKKFVWPKFEPVVCQLENYLYSQQA